jgi:hypothetical protein
MKRAILFFTIGLCTIFSCKTENKNIEFSGREIDKVLGEMTELMVHDVTNPPLAMRFFSYTFLAGYQVMASHDSTLPRISEHLNGYPSFEKINFTNSDPQLAAIIAMMEVSKKIQPSGKRMELWEKNYLDSCAALGLSSKIIENSRAIGASVAKNMLAYAKADRYIQLAREDIQLIQTPQVFLLNDLKKAFQQAYNTLFTDDASVVESLGIKINLVPGSYTNIKITNPEDLLIADQFLSASKTK